MKILITQTDDLKVRDLIKSVNILTWKDVYWIVHVE